MQNIIDRLYLDLQAAEDRVDEAHAAFVEALTFQASREAWHVLGDALEDLEEAEARLRAALRAAEAAGY